MADVATFFFFFFLRFPSFLFHSAPSIFPRALLWSYHSLSFFGVFLDLTDFTLHWCSLHILPTFFLSLQLMACFFINHLHPYSLLSFLISSLFLHHFVLSFPSKVPHILLLVLLLLLAPCHSLWGLLILYWGPFSSLSCQKEMGSSDVPSHDKQILSPTKLFGLQSAHTHKLKCKTDGRKRGMIRKARWRKRGEGELICTPIHF